MMGGRMGDVGSGREGEGVHVPVVGGGEDVAMHWLLFGACSLYGYWIEERSPR